MTTPQLALPAPRAAETRIIASVSAAHFISHFFFLVLPPLFDFVRAEYSLTYTELALAIAVFNIVSAVFQTPAGIFADRVGAFAVLVAGVVLGSFAFTVAGLVHSYWVLVIMFGVAGLANTVYHPADYALLSHHVSGERIGSAFSIHTFAGMLGGAVAPASMWFAQAAFGWRGAFLVAAALGLVVAAILLLLRDDFADSPHHARKEPEHATAERRELLRSWPILASFVFFMLQAATFVGVQTFSPVALQAAFNTPLETGNTALSASMFLSAIGVLAGGVMVNRVKNHRAFASLGLFVAGVGILLAGTVDWGALILISLMGMSGFMSGLIMPSRDLLVREVTPPGAFGTVFGFVTTGFNVAGVAFPLIFAMLLDHGMPRLVFVLSAVLCVLSILTVVVVRSKPQDSWVARQFD
jgi:MFS transporter, FSR family, fosmidomycin resistance protein